MKDFAINEYGANEEEIANLSLNNVIQKYFSHMGTHDFVRGIQILGNDCTHYINKHEDYSPNEIEQFYRIFVSLISNQYKCRRLEATAR